MRRAWVGSLQADVERRASRGSKAVSEKSLGSGTLTLEGRDHERENLLGRGKVNASKVDKEGTCQEAEAGDKATRLLTTVMKGLAWELGVWWELGGIWIIRMQGGFRSNRKALCSRQLITVFLN